MVIILGINKKRFFGLRWKLVSTYLLLVLLTILLINSFISESLRINYISEKKINLLTQCHIIADRVSPYIEDSENSFIKNRIKDVILKFSNEIKSRVIVTDMHSNIVVDAYDILEGEKLNNQVVSLALLGKSTSKQLYLKSHGRVLYLAVPVVSNERIVGSIFISTSIEDVYEKIRKTIQKFIILSFFGLAITAFISFFFADIISKPIEKLTIAVKMMSQGKFNQKVEVYGNDEITDLSKAFNIMTTKLDQVDKQRQDFVANVSHELRTPLSSVKILSDSIVQDENMDPKLTREFIKDINNEIDRLSKIIDNLLYLVDIEKENLEIDYQLTYVNHMVKRIVNTLTPLANNKEITIVMNDNDEKIQIMLDQMKIQQALINIIGNAIKYTPEGGRVYVDLYVEKNMMVISIKDTGIGIPKSDLPFIFDRFYRVDKARARKTGGTGLGLSITQQIMSLHQGEIDVESEVNQGTTFYLKLPMGRN